MNHAIFMEQALELAKKGKFKTAPNPCVGAVLVYNNTVIARGYHEEYGKAHAEVNCLLDAIKSGIFYQAIQENNVHFSNPLLQKALEEYRQKEFSKNINLAECTLYVTLEPCNHFGKTPPCTHAIIEAGIKTVVIGMLDPNPKASGGIAYLQENSVTIISGILEEKCRDLLADFLLWQKEQRPFCILKMAMTLDGKIGPNQGHSHTITTSKSKEVTMKFRHNVALAHGAVMIGANTFYLDNPQLNVRNIETDIQPKAIVLTNKLPSPETDYFLINKRASETIFYTSEQNEEKITVLENRGVSIEIIEKKSCDCINLKKVFENAFQIYKCPYIYCEGGAMLALSLIKEGLVDLLVVYISPQILGDDNAKSAFRGNFVETMQDAYHFKFVHSEMVGEDMHVYLKPEKTCSQD